MNFARVAEIADAVLYEGYALYPYRASSRKNRSRFTFGTLAPEGHGDASALRCECLLEGPPEAEIEVRARFVHLVRRTIARVADGRDPIAANDVASIELGNRRLQAWDEACARDVDVGPLSIAALIDEPHAARFAFDGGVEVETVREPGGTAVAIVRRERQAIAGVVGLAIVPLELGLYRLIVSVSNVTPLPARADRAAVELRSLGSAHVVLGARGAAFVSLLDPPAPKRTVAEACRNPGAWPVLAGEPGSRDLVLCSPIVLYDYPAVAPESPGDLFDATEMDEMLALRILTLADEEKREAASTDDRIRALLERTARLSDDELARLHGAVRGMRTIDAERTPAKVAKVRAGGVDLGPGNRVRLRPSGRSDVFDLVLEGLAATIVSVEEDYEHRVFVTVTIDDDPGRDLGVSGQPGHRFFFRPDELDPRPNDERDP